jgi:transcription elongation GreA/GreB family factor
MSSKREIDKRAIIAAMRMAMAREAEVLTTAATSAREAATHEENKPENDKDTRALEAAYLAGAQADRVRDLGRADNALQFLTLRPFGDGDKIALTALVEVEVDGASQHYFLSPVGGGMRVDACGISVLVVTPEAPVGRALVGKEIGDVVEVRAREYEIVGVC